MLSKIISRSALLIVFFTFIGNSNLLAQKKKTPNTSSKFLMGPRFKTYETPNKKTTPLIISPSKNHIPGRKENTTHFLPPVDPTKPIAVDKVTQ